MTAELRSLAGSWQFQADPDGNLTPETLAPSQTIPVPMPWQAAIPEMEHYSGYAWYRTTFTSDRLPDTDRLHLTFGAADYLTDVYVNRQHVGKNEGGYLPFTFDITAYLNDEQGAENEIAVRVYDVAQTSIVYHRWPDQIPGLGEIAATEIPHGKQEWYINVGGLWQDVTLARVPATSIKNVMVTPDIRTGEIAVRVELGGEISAGTVEISCHDQSAQVVLLEKQRRAEATLTIADPHLWSVESPYLYKLEVKVRTSDGDHSYVMRFGFREIKTVDGQLMLNGEPLFLLSALDQDLYPDTIYTVPSREYIADQFAKAKQLGLNCLRCHIKVADPVYLELADEMGLLIWAEVPSWRTFFPRDTIHDPRMDLPESIKDRVEAILRGMIARDYNHPSIIAWTIVNEDWGTTLPVNGADRTWVKTLYDLAKSLDSTRLVVDNSPCPSHWGPNVHVKSDLDDFHFYTNIPDAAGLWAKGLESFANRPLWTYSAFGDAERTGKEPLILSEFGNWGLPTLGGLRKNGTDPGWFDIGPWWSPWDGEPGWPRGVEERFACYGLDAIWKDYDTFAVASQWHQYHAMKYEIETMRRLPAVAGYVITEFTDAYWESNGLLDFERGVKAYHDLFAQVNGPDVLVMQPERYSAWSGDSLRLKLFVSHYSKGTWQATRVVSDNSDGSNSDAQTIAPIPDVQPGQVVALNIVKATLPTVEKSEAVELAMHVEASNGRVLTRNSIEVLVLPTSAQKAAYTGSVFVPPASQFETTFSDEEDTAQPLGLALKAIGYRVESRLTSGIELVISNRVDSAQLAWIQDGGSLLYISEGIGPFYWHMSRNGAYSGNWMSSFNWLRPGVHARLGDVVNPLRLPFGKVAPNGVIVGLPVEDAQIHNDLLAGQFSGWIGHFAPHTVAFRYGAGKVIMTTYSLHESLATMTGGIDSADPVAVAMTHDLVDYLIKCDPVLRGK